MTLVMSYPLRACHLQTHDVHLPLIVKLIFSPSQDVPDFSTVVRLFSLAFDRRSVGRYCQAMQTCFSS